MKKLATLLFLFSLFPFMAHAETFEEGRHYTRIIPEQPTDSLPGRIEVVEVFWYGCPHCFHYQAYEERWLKTKAPDVDYKRLPAVLRQDWALHGYAFYTAEALGILDKIHKPLFDAIHMQKRNLNDEASLMQFFGEFGVSNDDFKKTFHSFTVDAKVRRALEMSRRYHVQGTPSIVVNGKYLVDGNNANGSFPTMMKIIDFLVDKERKGRS